MEHVAPLQDNSPTPL